MKKIILAASVALCLSVSSLSVYFAAQTAFRHNRTSASQNKQINKLTAQLEELELSTECFALLRETEGVIGIYDADGKVLLCTIDTPVISLPQKERGQIMVGLKVRDAFHFLSLFENLSG